MTTAGASPHIHYDPCNLSLSLRAHQARAIAGQRRGGGASRGQPASHGDIQADRKAQQQWRHATLVGGGGTPKCGHQRGGQPSNCRAHTHSASTCTHSPVEISYCCCAHACRADAQVELPGSLLVVPHLASRQRYDSEQRGEEGGGPLCTACSDSTVMVCRDKGSSSTTSTSAAASESHSHVCRSAAQRSNTSSPTGRAKQHQGQKQVNGGGRGRGIQEGAGRPSNPMAR